MAVSGFRVPVHQALTQPILLMGVPRTLAILNGTVAAAVTLGLHSWLMLPVCALIHGVSALLARKDPYFFQVMLRSLRRKPYYRA